MSDRVKETAIVCLTILGCFALYKGIDGVLFAGIAAAISGLGGYTLGRIKNNRDKSLTRLEKGP